MYGERYNTGLRQREIDVGTQVSSGIGERERDFEGNREDEHKKTNLLKKLGRVWEGGGGGTGGG